MWKTSEKPSVKAQADARKRAMKALEAMTDEEDAAITKAALADPDAQPADSLFRRKRGRPAADASLKKVGVYMKLDPDVVGYFRASGKGWHTRVNQILRRAAKLK